MNEAAGSGIYDRAGLFSVALFGVNDIASLALDGVGLQRLEAERAGLNDGLLSSLWHGKGMDVG
jgi:hypothetical protein